MDITIVASIFGAFFVGFLGTYLLVKPKSRAIEEKAEKEAERIRKNAETEAERLVTNGRQMASQVQENAKKEENQIRVRLEKTQEQADERILKREEMLDKKAEKMDESRERYEEKIRSLESKEKEWSEKIEQEVENLSKISKLSEANAKKMLLERVEDRIQKDLADTMEKRIEAMRSEADKEASQIIIQSVQRYASSSGSESAITVVKIDSDDLKGKIIGREGRNITAFGNMTGVDVIIDDTPGTITLSSFDMFRRYIAKIALEELIRDGRIHPSRIEDCVKKAQNSAENLLLDMGKHACQELDITGWPDPILKLLGRLRFRTSYGQNVLQHSIEVAYIAQAMAYELPGADPDVCKKSGLVHDIGKAVSHEVEGGHAIIGMEILRKFGIDEPIITAMKSHHEDFPYESLEARIIQAADALSASRPGARRETMEKYLKRVKEFEAIANSFDGVEKAFAIQAGRELRVFVNAAELNDLQAEKLSFDISRKIEEHGQYPGEVRVAVIREARYEATAK